MQVSCGHCGMRYEFDAAEIPAEGYDAQCSNCNNVFFVAPEVSGHPAAPPAHVDAPVSPQVSVQVAIGCPQCGALYQFESIDVPEAGYDAQCTQCDSVFLVAPHTVAPYDAQADEQPEAAEDETSFAEVSELLGQAVDPKSTAADNGDNGDNDDMHDAQTAVTRKEDIGLSEPETGRHGFSPQLLDGGTFERTDPNMRVPQEFAERVNVSSEPQPGFAEPPPPPEASIHNRDTAEPEAAFAPDGGSSERTFTGVLPSDTTRVVPVAGLAATPPEAEALPALNAWTTAAEQSERLSAEPTNPAMILKGPGRATKRTPTEILPADEGGDPPRLAASAAPDPAAARRDRRRKDAQTPPQGRGLRIVLVILMLVLGALYALTELRPDLVAQVLRQNVPLHAVTGEAASLFEQGKKALLRDTDADYETAIETFGKALQQDAQYPEAQAWQVVGHSLRGADLRHEGGRLYADWEQEQALWRGFKALERQGAALSPDQAAQAGQLEEQGPKHLQAATDMLERGGKELSVAQVQAQRARTLLPRSAPVAAAAALCYTETPNDMAVAQSLLSQYAGLSAAGADTNPGKVAAPQADIWLLLAQGRVAATQQSTREQARTAFSKALEIEPNLTRARWELAQLDVQAGALDEAKKRYKEILAAVPNHPKSMAALAALDRPTPAQPEPAAAPAAPPPANDDPQAPATPPANDEAQAPAAPAARRFRHRRRAAPPANAPATAPDAGPAAEEPAPVNEKE